MYKLVLFDLDGVLIDSKKNMEVSWAAVSVTYDLGVDFERYFELIGRPFTNIMEKLGLDERADQIKQVYDVASSCRLDLVEIYPDCMQLVNDLKNMGMRVGLVTSKDRARTLEVVKKMDVLFDVVDCPEPGHRGKPHPDPLLRAMLQCHSDPAETVYIGDMQVDYECTQRAGVDYVHVDWGYGSCKAAPARAKNTEQLKDLILKKGERT